MTEIEREVIRAFRAANYDQELAFIELMRGKRIQSFMRKHYILGIFEGFEIHEQVKNAIDSIKDKIHLYDDWAFEDLIEEVAGLVQEKGDDFDNYIKGYRTIYDWE